MPPSTFRAGAIVSAPNSLSKLSWGSTASVIHPGHIATHGADGTSRIWALNGQQIAQYEEQGFLRDDWQPIAVVLQPDAPHRENTVVQLWPVDTLDRLDDLLAAACQRLTPYLAHNPNRTDVDRALCNLPPLNLPQP